MDIMKREISPEQEEQMHAILDKQINHLSHRSHNQYS